MSAASAFEACIRSGGVAVFPADTVYGLACDPEDGDAIRRLYELKGRPRSQPSSVMVFALEHLHLPELGPRTQQLLEQLLPGPLTLLLPNPRRRFPLAGETLGLRVPDLPALAGVRVPVLQSSANLSGAPDARRLQDVPATIRDRADLVLDGGELPGTPSTIVDLRAYEAGGELEIVRVGAVPEAVIRSLSR
jgi:L-threonylcarbamoyladenylate synthase